MEDTTVGGGFVTRAEFNLLTRAVDMVGADVKKILRALALEEGREQAVQQIATASKDRERRRVNRGLLAGTVLGGLWWVRDTLLYFTSHGHAHP
jgi:hypothetical protein